MSKNAISAMSVEQLNTMRAINRVFIAGFTLRTEFNAIDDIRACEIYYLHVSYELKLMRAMNLLKNERWKQEGVCVVRAFTLIFVLKTSCILTVESCALYQITF